MSTATVTKEDILVVDDLKTDFFTESGRVRAVDGANLGVRKGEVLGLIGESGSGKTALALSLLRLLPRVDREERGGDSGFHFFRTAFLGGDKGEEARSFDRGEIVGGRILFHGDDILRYSEEEMRRVRGEEIAMLFQEPVSHLNPLEAIGEQTGETVESHRDIERDELQELVLKELNLVELADPELRRNLKPDAFSAGEAQRIFLAMSLIAGPELLIADEPTSALNVTVQQEVIWLLEELKERFGLSVLFISHDLGLIAQVSDRVAVMYAGQIVETGPTEEVFTYPHHPYTKALLEATPRLGMKKLLKEIPGSHPDMLDPPEGCRFHPRCEFVRDICKTGDTPLQETGPSRTSSCLRLEEIEGELKLET